MAGATQQMPVLFMRRMATIPAAMEVIKVDKFKTWRSSLRTSLSHRMKLP